MRLPVIIINDCWEYIIEVEVEDICGGQDLNGAGIAPCCALVNYSHLEDIS